MFQSSILCFYFFSTHSVSLFPVLLHLLKLNTNEQMVKLNPIIKGDAISREIWIQITLNWYWWFELIVVYLCLYSFNAFTARCHVPCALPPTSNYTQYAMVFQMLSDNCRACRSVFSFISIWWALSWVVSR